MTALLLPALLASAAMAIVLIAAAVVVARHDVLHPATVDPFYGTPQGVTCEDTVPMSNELVQTVLAPKSDWQSKNFRSLSHVEDMLDSLEAHGFQHREVVVLTDDCFTVRWK